MLVLTRKPGQSIKIGDDIEIMVTRVADGRVRLSVAAPHDTKIVRTELLEAPRGAKQ